MTGGHLDELQVPPTLLSSEDGRGEGPAEGGGGRLVRGRSPIDDERLVAAHSLGRFGHYKL